MAGKQAYHAYSVAIQTTPKTRQVVMLYDGVVRFLKQAQTAIAEKRVEDRFNLLLKASQIITGLQSSLDFGGNEDITKISHTLQQFYTGINVRILSVNFMRDIQKGQEECGALIEEILQMRKVWNDIDHSVHKPESAPAGNAAPAEPAANPTPMSKDGHITFSA